MKRPIRPTRSSEIRTYRLLILFAIFLIIFLLMGRCKKRGGIFYASEGVLGLTSRASCAATS